MYKKYYYLGSKSSLMKPHEIKDQMLTYLCEQTQDGYSKQVSYKEIQDNISSDCSVFEIGLITDELKDSGYILIENMARTFFSVYVTINGIAFLQSGGYTALYTEQKAEKEAVKNEQKLTKLHVKWFKITIGISILSFLMSLIALFV